MNDEKDRLPGWESDFWRDLMEEQNVYGVPDPTFYGGAEKAKTSPYWTPDTLVGEIVEDDQPCITA